MVKKGNLRRKELFKKPNEITLYGYFLALCKLALDTSRIHKRGTTSALLNIVKKFSTWALNRRMSAATNVISAFASAPPTEPLRQKTHF